MQDTEKTLDYLEEQIPTLAAAAVNVAYWQALASGQTVFICDDGALCEVFPDGPASFSKHWRSR